MFRPLVLLLALLLAGASGHAAEVGSPDLAKKIPGTGRTYLDLVRQIIPDVALASDGGYEGHRLIDIRRIDDGSRSEPPEKIAVINADALPIQSDGKDRLLLLLDIGQIGDVAGTGFAVLALFDLAGKPRLVDAADVSFDVSTYFFDPGFLQLGEGKNAVLTLSTHFNSSEAYNTTALILPRGDRLELIDTVDTFHLSRCGYVRDEVPAFHAGDRDGHVFADIVATITETTTLSNEDCGSEQPAKAGTRVIAVTYRWDDTASRFVPNSDAFEKLFEEDQERL